MARETINGISVPVPGTGEPADFQGDLRRFATDLPASTGAQVDQEFTAATADGGVLKTFVQNYVVVNDLGASDGQVKTLVETPTSATRLAVEAQYMRRRSVASEEVATLGPELATDTGWTLGAGWTGDFTTGFTKTAGGTGTLSFTPPATGTDTYMVELTVDTPSSSTINSYFTMTLGGSFAMVMFEGEFLSHTYNRALKSVSSGAFVFTPQNEFAGTVSNISIRMVDISAGATGIWKDSTGATVTELRNSTAALRNQFFGFNAGRRNISGHNNAVMGYNALSLNVTGFWNAAIGAESLRDNVNGTRNCAVGYNTLTRNITGHRNVAVGPWALHRNTHGHSNVGIGVDVHYHNTTGNYNIAIGTGALGDAVTGDSLVAIGRAALILGTAFTKPHVVVGDSACVSLSDDSTGTTVAVGANALNKATKGGNVALGNSAAFNVTTGTGNLAIGNDALNGVTTTTNSVAVGTSAIGTPTGERNTALGANAMLGAPGSTAERNLALGYGALAAVSSGSRNTVVGTSAGATTTSGSDNILIGYNVQLPSATDSNYMNIGNLIYGKLGSNLQVGIGVTGPTARLHLQAGQATAGKAPLKLNAGVNLTTPEAGAVEFDGANLYFTTAAGVRKTLATV